MCDVAHTVVNSFSTPLHTAENKSVVPELISGGGMREKTRPSSDLAIAFEKPL
jgi:hypothetical protein